MLKTRIVAVLIVRNDIVVQSIGFKKYLPVGKASIAIEYLDQWGVDEIILLNITSERINESYNVQQLIDYSRYCHVPLTVGGGVQTINDIKSIIQSGADKVAINSSVHNNSNLISDAKQLFGRQCIVASIDVKKVNEAEYSVYVMNGNVDTKISPTTMAKKVEQYGAGEIIINSIDQDGAKKGYDLTLLEQVIDAVNIPVIACGGVGNPDHFKAAIDLGASGVAAANFFHYTEHSITLVKRHLVDVNYDIRLDSYFTYEGYELDNLGRVKKKADSKLEKLRFEHIDEEVI